MRKIIQIDAEKCNGCGACAQACHEGAIGMVDGKAVLLREDYCDGLGDCLPACPTDAISFVYRQAAAYDPAAVEQHQAALKSPAAAPAASSQGQQETLACGCPGTHARAIRQTQSPSADASHSKEAAPTQGDDSSSQLSQWPVQIKLVPVDAPYFDGARLLVAADCTAYAYGSFHSRFIRGHITLIGCPKLDEGDYADKLTRILQTNSIKSVTIVRMEVPCCGGLERAVRTALQNCGKLIPWQTVVISTDGRILED